MFFSYFYAIKESQNRRGKIEDKEECRRTAQIGLSL